MLAAVMELINTFGERTQHKRITKKYQRIEERKNRCTMHTYASHLQSPTMGEHIDRARAHTIYVHLHFVLIITHVN